MGEYLEDKLQGQYTFEDTTNVAIKFSIQPPGQKSIDIDLILSPYFADHHEYLRELKRVQPPALRYKMYIRLYYYIILVQSVLGTIIFLLMHRFSVSSSKYQTEFIQQQHIWVCYIIVSVALTRHCHTFLQAKEFIRRAKAWRNIEWRDSNIGKPKSYMMSILVIIAFDRMPFDMKKLRRGGMYNLVPL